MSVKATIEGIDSVLLTLRDKSYKAKKNAKVDLHIGYACPYAVYVHENLTANHPNGGQAKYLEEPSRTYSTQMAEIANQAVRRGSGLAEALMEAGEFLLAKSRELVPVDTGLLKSSGYVRVKTGVIGQ